MALPTLQKTWQIDANLFVNAMGITDHCSRVLHGIKESLIGFSTNPLTVAGSGTTAAAGMDAVDRWVSPASLTWGTGAHSWIVLERVDGIQICFDLNNASATSIDVVVSLSGAFTGGSTTARPTASDEFENVQWNKEATSSTTYYIGFYNTSQATCRYHVWNSTDGLSQRVVGFRRANTCFFWRFELIDPVSPNFDPPFIASIVNSHTSSYEEALESQYFLDIWGYFEQYKKGSFRANSVNSYLYQTSLRSEWPMASWALVAEDIDGLLQMTEIVYVSRTTGTRGVLGTSHDLWVTNEAIVNNGDSFPDDPDDRQFACAGCVVLPWTGDSTVMLVA